MLPAVAKLAPSDRPAVVSVPLKTASLAAAVMNTPLESAAEASVCESAWVRAPSGMRLVYGSA